MKTSIRHTNTLGFCALFLILGSAPPVFAKSSFDFLEPEYTVGEIFQQAPKTIPRRIAVLPVLNLDEDEEDASDTIRKLIYNHFSALGYRDVEMALVDRGLTKSEINDAKSLWGVDHKTLKKALQVDGVIRAKVKKYETIFALFASTVTVKVEIEFIDLETGATIWKGKQTGRSIDGGVPLDLLSAAAAIFASSQNAGETIKQRVANEVVFELISKIPNLPNSVAFQTPKIRLMEHTGTQGPIKGGDELKVLVKAEPKLDAFFTVEGLVNEQPMQEVDAGIYIGKFQVDNKTNINRANLTIRVVDEAGNQGRISDYHGGVTIDNTPPPTPKITDIGNQDRSVVISWRISDESDVSKYQVYRSLNPISGYKLVSALENQKLLDSQLANGKAYYYKLAAEDRAGNLSALSERVIGHPVRKGPTLVSGLTIDSDTTWYAAASPYVIDGKVEVTPTGLLKIEPGTHVTFKKNSKISVKGKIIWRGLPTKPIRFESYQSDMLWVGVLLEKTRRKNAIQHLEMSDSKHGLVILDSTLSLTDSVFRHNQTGLQLVNVRDLHFQRLLVEQNKKGVSLKRSNIQISESKIRHNKHLGMLITESLPRLKHNQLVNNGEFNLFILNGNNQIVDIDGQHWGGLNKWQILDSVWGKVTLDSFVSKDGKVSKFKKLKWSDSKKVIIAENKLELVLTKGIKHYEEGNFTKAQSLLTAYSREKIEARPLFYLAKIAQWRERYLKAEKLFQSAARLQFSEADFNVYFAKNYWNLNKKNEAKSLLTKKMSEQSSPSKKLLLAYQLTH